MRLRSSSDSASFFTRLQELIDVARASPGKIIYGSPEEFAQFLKQDLQKYAEIARKPKIEPQQSFDEFPAARRLDFGPG